MFCPEMEISRSRLFSTFVMKQGRETLLTCTYTLADGYLQPGRAQRGDRVFRYPYLLDYVYIMNTSYYVGLPLQCPTGEICRGVP